jgi:hypothetical protein
LYLIYNNNAKKIRFIIQQIAPTFNGLPPMRAEQVPAYYSCYNNLQIVGNINLQNMFDLNSPQQTAIADVINSQSRSSVSTLALHNYFKIDLICVLR